LYSIIKEKENNFPGLKVIFNDIAPGMAASRNIGAKESTGEIVAFVDDDAVLTTQWAEETAHAYDNDSRIIGLTGPIVPLWEEPSMGGFRVNYTGYFPVLITIGRTKRSQERLRHQHLFQKRSL